MFFRFRFKFWLIISKFRVLVQVLLSEFVKYEWKFHFSVEIITIINSSRDYRSFLILDCIVNMVRSYSINFELGIRVFNWVFFGLKFGYFIDYIFGWKFVLWWDMMLYVRNMCTYLISFYLFVLEKSSYFLNT